METTVKNRAWVKDAAIIFLAVLLVLTFFSNTIMNRSLPEVATAPVTNGNIVAKVRGSGTVAANGKHQVKAKETRTIRSVMVKAGQEVNAGDVLFVLGEGDETELEQAKEKLRSLQTSYQRTALSTPVADYSSYYRAIENAEIAYQRAYDEYEAAYNREFNPVTEAAKKRYEAAKDRAEKLESEYEKYSATRSAELGEELDYLYDQLASYETAAQIQQDALAEAQSELDKVMSETEGMLEEYLSVLQEKEAEYELILKDVDDVPIEVFNLHYDAWVNAKNDYDTALINAQAARTVAEQAVATAQANLDAALGPEYQAILGKISGAEAELASLDESAHYEEVRKAVEERDRLYEEYSNLAGYALQNAEYGLEEAEIALDAAYDSLDAAQANNNRSAASTGVELQSIAEEIKLQQEKIKSLAGEESNVVTADVSGTVDTVDCTAGDTVLKSALLCTIEVPDMGHTLSFAVTNAQAQRLRIGDSATVSNYYWGNSVTATLTSIRTDPKNPQTGKLLTFDLTGDVTTGAEMTISVGQKSATYDLIVPNSAIKSDTNGSYVLAVTAKSSPLGNRYSAKRISVEVLASDDNNSAVLADLSNGDYVITTSSAPIKSGDLVRMADS